MCYLCLRALSTDCEHVIPHRGDPVKFWDVSNLRGACHDCNTWKARLEEAFHQHWREVLLRKNLLELETLLPW